MKILITGGKGDLAQTIKKHLSEHEIISPDKNEMDVKNEQSVKLFIEKTKPDLLINCAGVMERELLVDSKKWEDVINVNLIGTYYCCKYAIQNKCKTIVNIASTAGIYGNKGFSAYSASKAGVILLTECLALENVNVYCIAPSRFGSSMRDEVFPGETDVALLDRDVIGRTILDILAGSHIPGKKIIIKKHL